MCKGCTCGSPTDEHLSSCGLGIAHLSNRLARHFGCDHRNGYCELPPEEREPRPQARADA